MEDYRDEGTDPSLAWWAASDFGEYAFPMKSCQDVLDKLKELTEQGVDITEVYFYDHGSHKRYLGVWEIYWVEFGEGEENEVRVSARKDFWKQLGDAVPENCVLNFRSCDTGYVASKLAQYTGRTVTACKGKIWLYNEDRNGKNYDFLGDLVKAYPNGKVETLWSYYIEILALDPLSETPIVVGEFVNTAQYNGY